MIIILINSRNFGGKMKKNQIRNKFSLNKKSLSEEIASNTVLLLFVHFLRIHGQNTLLFFDPYIYNVLHLIRIYSVTGSIKNSASWGNVRSSLFTLGMTIQIRGRKGPGAPLGGYPGMRTTLPPPPKKN